jgi:cytoskeleton protein RodZ
MADIGSILRETRIREKVDITSVERATKIRAKYLRALETEEWDVLPGPAYVKSFLRTYAEFLGIDAHMLVEEYRARFEEPEDLELPAFAPDRPLRGRVRPPGPPSRIALIAGLGLALVAILFVLGITSGGDGDDDRRTRAEDSAERRGRGGRGSDARSTPTRRRGARVALAVSATRNVWVCLVDVGGRTRIPGRTMTGGDREGPFRSRRFLLTVGNGGADLAIDGRRRDLPETSSPQGYAVTAAAVRKLPEGRRPTCAPGESTAGTGSP